LSTSPRWNGIQEQVLEFLQSRIGLHTTLGTIVNELEAEAPVEYNAVERRRAVANSTAQLANKGLIRRIATGVYVYDGREKQSKFAASDGHLYETIGCLENGAQVVRSDDGALFVLASLEDYISRIVQQ